MKRYPNQWSFLSNQLIKNLAKTKQNKQQQQKTKQEQNKQTRTKQTKHHQLTYFRFLQSANTSGLFGSLASVGLGYDSPHNLINFDEFLK